jgi:succinyl-diaminopimelate desuccinylase
MKGGLAAFLAAAEAFVAGGHKGTLSLLVTGDEEGVAVNGTVKTLAWAIEQGHAFDAALIGEPTSRQNLGDTVKIGRRGSLSGTVTVLGRQGHVAYPHLADNPIPRLARIVDRLSRLALDEGTEGFQPSNLEVVALETDTRAFNVIPAEAHARFNIRFNDRWSIPGLKDLLAAEIEAEGVGGTLNFEAGASEWFLTRAGSLIAPLTAAITEVTGVRPEMSTGGGTSDARFFRDVCPVVEFGLVGDTMHQVDERVPLADLDKLTAIYRGFLERFFA